MAELLVDVPMAKEKGPEKEATVVKMERELVDLIKFIINSRNRALSPGEKMTISSYLADITRKQIITDYNIEAKKVKQLKPEE